MKNLFANTVLVFAFVLTFNASATLIGDTVNVNYAPQFSSTENSNPVVGNGFEWSKTMFTYIQPGQNPLMARVDLFLDIADGQVTVGLAQYGAGSPTFAYSTNSSDVFTISDLDWIGVPAEVTGFRYAGQTATLGAWQTDPSLWITNFSTDEVSFRIEGGWETGLAASDTILASATFDIETRHQAPIPEPATVSLLGIGLITLRLFRSKCFGRV